MFETEGGVTESSYIPDPLSHSLPPPSLKEQPAERAEPLLIRSMIYTVSFQAERVLYA